GEDLIDGYTEMNVRADGLFRANAAEDSCAARMITAGFTGRGHGRRRVKSADHGDGVPPWFQRLENERKLIERAFLHCPVFRLPAMWIEDADKPRDLRCRLGFSGWNERRKHRVQ